VARITNKRTSSRRGSRFSLLSKGLVRTRGKMNASEKKYSKWLETLVAAGEVSKWWFEPFSLRLTACDEGKPARYTPDFVVLMMDGLTFVDDLKTERGFDDPASLVRIKVAADQYSLWRFRIVRPDGSGFVHKEI
jgi:hypothetical protein